MIFKYNSIKKYKVFSNYSYADNKAKNIIRALIYNKKYKNGYVLGICHGNPFAKEEYRYIITLNKTKDKEGISLTAENTYISRCFYRKTKKLILDHTYFEDIKIQFLAKLMDEIPDETLNDLYQLFIALENREEFIFTKKKVY